LTHDYQQKMMMDFMESLKNGDLDWQHLALCAETDPDAFFPEEGGSHKNPKKICQQCPVQLDCLEYAIRNNETHGVWGGLSPRERQRIRSQRLGIKGRGRPIKEIANA
jgi:WhiB family transcriptional regulator, redox-sensing transcriptional regulator